MIFTLYVRGEVYARCNGTVLFQFEATTTPGETVIAVGSGNTLHRFENSEEMAGENNRNQVYFASPAYYYFIMSCLRFNVSSMSLYA